MCGRFAQFSRVSTLEGKFGSVVTKREPSPNYNVAPTDAVLVYRLHPTSGQVELVPLRWGLIPYWSRDPEKTAARFRMINARAESVAEKPAFKWAFRRRRCLIPADGFYEWKKDTRPRQPYFIQMRSGEPMALAGLWERWEAADGSRVIESCTVIVTAANSLVAQLHERMPVIIAPEDHDFWMDHTSSKRKEELMALLKPYPPGELEMWPVSRRVNNPDHKEQDLVQPLQIHSE